MRKYLCLCLISALFLTSCASSHNLPSKQASVLPSPTDHTTQRASAYHATHYTETFTPEEENLPQSNAPHRIALLLPLNGSAGKQGQAIQNGFLAAYYDAKKSGHTPEVAVLDTSNGDIMDTYHKAVQDGADVVVGPLLKSDVEALARSGRLPIKTIALNTRQENGRVNNLFQFGLDPIDEVQQVAERLREDAKNRVLIITPDNNWGQRVQSTFQPYWNTLGGKITAEIRYRSQAQLSQQLRDTFHLEDSQQRYLRLRATLREKVRFTPRRRQDFDAIFLVASPEMGRQILPLVRFYYANNVPTYSTSQIYQGVVNAQSDHDLDGILFDDMPWLFTNQLKTAHWITRSQQNAKTAWPKSYQSYPRLYALGADAFALCAHLSNLSASTNTHINLATGELSINANGKVYRRLVWVQMKNGQPAPL